MDKMVRGRGNQEPQRRRGFNNRGFHSSPRRGRYKYYSNRIKHDWKSDTKYFQTRQNRRVPSRPASRPASPIEGTEDYLTRKIQHTSAIIMKQLLNPEEKATPQFSNHNKHNEAILISQVDPIPNKGSTKHHNKMSPKKIKKAARINLNAEQIHEKIMSHITNLNEGRKKNFINATGSAGLDNALSYIQKQKRLEISRVLRDMNLTSAFKEVGDATTSIVPDIGIKIEELPYNVIEELGRTLNLDLDVLNEAIADCAGLQNQNATVGVTPGELNAAPIADCADLQNQNEIASVSSGELNAAINSIEVKRECEFELDEPQSFGSVEIKSEDISDIFEETAPGTLPTQSRAELMINKEIQEFSSSQETVRIKEEVKDDDVNEQNEKSLSSVSGSFAVSDCSTVVYGHNLRSGNQKTRDFCQNYVNQVSRHTNVNTENRDNRDRTICENDVNNKSTCENVNSIEATPKVTENTVLSSASVCENDGNQKLAHETLNNKTGDMHEVSSSVGCENRQSEKSGYGSVRPNGVIDKFYSGNSEKNHIGDGEDSGGGPSNSTQSESQFQEIFNSDSLRSFETLIRQFIEKDTSLECSETDTVLEKIDLVDSCVQHFTNYRKSLTKSIVRLCKRNSANKNKDGDVVCRSCTQSTEKSFTQQSSQTRSGMFDEESDRGVKRKKIGEEEQDRETDTSVKEEVVSDVSEPERILELPEVKERIIAIERVEDQLILATETGNILFISLNDGSLLESLDVCQSTITSLLFVRGMNDFIYMYVGTLENTLRVYNFRKRQLFKSCVTDDQIRCMDSMWDCVFMGCRNGTLIRYSCKKGKIEFQEKNAGDILVVKAAQEGPRRVLLVGHRKAPIYVRDAMSGLYLRNFSNQAITPTVYSLIISGNNLYCGTAKNNILVFSFHEGALKHKIVADESKGIGCMKIYQNHLFAGCYNGSIYVYNLENNKLVTILNGAGGSIFCMEVLHNQIIVGTLSSQFFSVKLPDGLFNS